MILRPTTSKKRSRYAKRITPKPYAYRRKHEIQIETESNDFSYEANPYYEDTEYDQSEATESQNHSWTSRRKTQSETVSMDSYTDAICILPNEILLHIFKFIDCGKDNWMNILLTYKRFNIIGASYFLGESKNDVKFIYKSIKKNDPSYIKKIVPYIEARLNIKEHLTQIMYHIANHDSENIIDFLINGNLIPEAKDMIITGNPHDELWIRPGYFAGSSAYKCLGIILQSEWFKKEYPFCVISLLHSVTSVMPITEDVYPKGTISRIVGTAKSLMSNIDFGKLHDGKNTILPISPQSNYIRKSFTKLIEQRMYSDASVLLDYQEIMDYRMFGYMHGAYEKLIEPNPDYESEPYSIDHLLLHEKFINHSGITIDMINSVTRCLCTQPHMKLLKHIMDLEDSHQMGIDHPFIILCKLGKTKFAKQIAMTYTLPEDVVLNSIESLSDPESKNMLVILLKGKHWSHVDKRLIKDSIHNSWPESTRIKILKELEDIL